ncbi:MAG: DUF1080 domain-containing protein [Phycisphaerales bacterium]|nr:DUF1080 domain-containing protein [Phycisphaerales bacterium]
MPRLPGRLLLAWLLILGVRTSFAQVGAGSGAPAAEAAGVVAPPGVEVYLGRRVAQTMHYSGAPWLLRESREREEGTRLMLEHLVEHAGLKAGVTVCDVGCGNGFYSLQLAKLVGAEGRVLGVDIQPEMLEMLKDRAKKAGVGNITPVLGSLDDPHLEAGSVDLALLVDVYHEFDHPEQMLARLRVSLAPGGRMVLAEFRAEDPDVPIKPEHKMSKAQVLVEMEANGFRLADSFDGLPWQHLLTFEAAEEPVGDALFDGETLGGWHAIGGGAWSVEGGAIVGRSASSDPRHGLLVSDASFADFLVTFEYRVVRGNSGFYFRSEESGDEVGVHGFQVEVDDLKPGGLYETGGRAWVVEPAPEQAAAWERKGGWNTVRLFARGEHLEVYVNGFQTAVLDDAEGRREGHFALQLHGGQDMDVAFRGLRIWSQ